MAYRNSQTWGRFTFLTVLFALVVYSAGLATPGLAQGTATPTPKKPLAAQVGFSDPELDKYQAMNMDTLGESVDFKGNGHTYRLLTVWEVGPDYPKEITSITGGAALLYQMDISKPKFLWSQNYLKLIGQVPYITNKHFDFFSAPQPGDWLGSGKTLFTVLGSFAGTAWFSTFYYIYEVKPDGSVTSRLKGVIPPGNIVVHIEPQEDKSLLLTLANIRGEMAMGLPNCCGPHIDSYFEWRGDKITDASAQHADLYYPMIGETLYQVTVEKIDDPANFAARILELLMAYDHLGQRAAGWTLAQGLIAQAKQSKRLAEGTYVDKVFLPAMDKLYKANKPFLAPDIDPKTGSIDFYSEIPMNQ